MQTRLAKGSATGLPVTTGPTRERDDEMGASAIDPPRPRAAIEGFPACVHLLGAGGAGVSGLGKLLALRGVRVSGHDKAPSALLDSLRRTGVSLSLGESSAGELPLDAELVVRSAAVPPEDPQVRAAEARGIAVLKYGDAIGRLSREASTFAIAGTHGKTTTSWLTWHALEGIASEFGAPMPGALIGGISRRLCTNAIPFQENGAFCVEACEYDRTFLNLAPRGAIVTNVEEDHLDYYGTFANIRSAFARFLDLVDGDGLIVLGREVPEDVEFAARARVWRLSRELAVDLLGEERGCFRFRLRAPGWATPGIALAVPGHFNVENAALALAVAVGLSAQALGRAPGDLAASAARGVERYNGAERRFEPWGKHGEVELVHDYAHHPTEVRVTLEAARRAYPDRALHVLFQPHQHSRTSRFLEEFAEALRSADRVVVTDVYGARKHIDGECYAGAPELVLALKRRKVDAVEGGPLGSSVERFVSGISEKAAGFVLGAGDIERVRDELLRQLALRSASERGARA